MTDTAARTVDIASIDISLDDAKPVERPFLGTITQDAFEDGRVYGPGDSGVQWHPMVTALRDGAKPQHDFLPLKYATAKEDGVTVYFDGHDLEHPIKYSMSGAFGRVLDSIRSVVGSKDSEGNDYKPGHGQLNGITCWWVQRTLTYGKDPVTGELRGANGRPHLVAVKKASADEIASAGGSAPSGAVAYSAEEIEAALTILDGRKPLEYQRLVVKADGKDGRPLLSADMKSAILAGTFAAYAVKEGLAMQDNGVIVRIRMAEAAA